jgi:hypothetical protein
MIDDGRGVLLPVANNGVQYYITSVSLSKINSSVVLRTMTAPAVWIFFLSLYLSVYDRDTKVVWQTVYI